MGCVVRLLTVVATYGEWQPVEAMRQVRSARAGMRRMNVKSIRARFAVGDSNSKSNWNVVICREDALEEGEKVGRAGRFFEDAGGEDGSAAVVVESDGEGEDAPGELLLVGAGLIEEAAAGA